MPPKRKYQILRQPVNLQISAQQDSSPSPAKLHAGKKAGNGSTGNLPPEQAKAISEWQEDMTSVAARDWYMFQNEMYTDCSFTIDNQREKPIEVKCHRNYLAKTSPYFSSMLYGKMKRKSDEAIHLPGVNLEAFKAMLEYVYLGKLDLHGYSYEVVCGLLHLAKMYLLPKIFREQIRNYLWENICPHNVWTAVEFGMSNDEPQLERTAWLIIESKTMQLLIHPSFLEISKSTLVALVQRNRIKCPEHRLFLCCLEWAEVEARRLGRDPDPVTLRDILEEVVLHIRFLAMDNKQISDVLKSGLLTDEECRPILVFHHTGELKNLSRRLCSQVDNRNSEIRQSDFEVLGHSTSIAVLANSKIKVGECCEDSTSFVLSRVVMNFHSETTAINFLGVKVPTQMKDLSPGVYETYEENLTLVLRKCDTLEILLLSHFKSTVFYNSIIEVPLDTPLQLTSEVNNKKFIISVIFHQSGKYPTKIDTTVPVIVQTGQRFNEMSEVCFYYNHSYNRYIYCVAYKTIH